MFTISLFVWMANKGIALINSRTTFKLNMYDIKPINSTNFAAFNL
jgi:hypothetical protein